MVQDTLETANCDAGFVIRRIWSATDICDNTSVIEQIISFDDITAPELIFNSQILKYLNATLEIPMSDANAVADVNNIDWFNIIAQDLCDGAIIRPIYSESVYTAEDCQAEGFSKKELLITISLMHVETQKKLISMYSLSMMSLRCC